MRVAFERTGASAVLLARGSLGNPWLFEELLGVRAHDPSGEEILAELHWVIGCACEHLGTERATRYLRKFYPWYVERLGADRALQDALQRAPTLDQVRDVLAGGRRGLGPAPSAEGLANMPASPDRGARPLAVSTSTGEAH